MKFTFVMEKRLCVFAAYYVNDDLTPSAECCLANVYCHSQQELDYWRSQFRKLYHNVTRDELCYLGRYSGQCHRNVRTEITFKEFDVSLSR